MQHATGRRQKAREQNARACPYFDKSANPHERCGVADLEPDGERCDVIDGVVDDYEKCVCYKANIEIGTPVLNRKKLIVTV
ncbi:MAG: hypothetical protein OEY88_07805 [Candidatus Bathyarchaeota archaeon]|nr:hypothetical protein [Candidatus Bathyarchaeota archaeon]